jgi:hypothetical protein
MPLFPASRHKENHMNALVEISVDAAMEQTGQRRDVQRRLSDKILAAFNHAYSVGEFEIAKQLKATLISNENKSAALKELRKSYDPLGDAEFWVGFVNARNSYRTECDKKDRDSAAMDQALETMKEAYRVWSER